MSYPQPSRILWTAYEAAAATGGSLLTAGGGRQQDGRAGADDWAASGISFDTRTLVPGDLFVALKDVRDGHDFLAAAAEKGAAAALVSRIPSDAPAGLPLLKVRDALNGLEALGAAARDRHFGKLIGVTGSVGKTTTKEMLRTVLSVAGRVHAAKRSFNNHLGVPASLAGLPQSTDYGVFEIGMNHAGEITPLVGLVRPHVSIITAIAPAHLENFDSVEGIARAKAEILSGVRPGGTAILPADSEFFDLLEGEAKGQRVTNIVAFGESVRAVNGCRLTEFLPTPDGSVTKATLSGEAFSFRLSSPGKHLAMNALAVVAAAHAVGVPLDQIVSGLEMFTAGDGRGAQRQVSLEGGQITMLDESYNANPASMAASMEVLGRMQPGDGSRRIAVLGSMKELGQTSDALHASLVEPISRAGVDLVLLAGDEMISLKHALPDDVVVAWAADAADLADPLVEVLKAGDIVLFKGSNASGIGALLSEFLAKSAAPE